MRDRLVELLEKASAEVGKHIRETTKKVLAEKGRFNSKEDIDRRNIYEMEADYLLANGVIVPPCKVGDEVYVICNHTVQETNVFSLKMETEDGKYVVYVKAKAVDGSNKTVDGYYEAVFKTFIFGKTVFLTREEAEAKQKEGDK